VWCQELRQKMDCSARAEVLSRDAETVVVRFTGVRVESVELHGSSGILRTQNNLGFKMDPVSGPRDIAGVDANEQLRDTAGLGDGWAIRRANGELLARGEYAVGTVRKQLKAALEAASTSGELELEFESPKAKAMESVATCTACNGTGGQGSKCGVCDGAGCTRE
jgi:hypothetical protein